jgi:hypothetical protein
MVFLLFLLVDRVRMQTSTNGSGLDPGGPKPNGSGSATFFIFFSSNLPAGGQKPANCTFSLKNLIFLLTFFVKILC